jgi:hypothetical protein
MNIRLLVILLGLISLMGCGSGNITVSGQLGEEIAIVPDYKEVTIPYNIAPLNFQVEIQEDACLLIEDAQGKCLQVHAQDGLFDIPLKAWQELLSANKGKDLKLTVCKDQNGAWMAYQPFTIHVA